MNIGYIGLGDIGLPMAQRIARAGLPLTVWNRTAARMAPLAEDGAATAGSAAELAERSDIVFLCIDTREGIEEILFGPTGVMQASRRPRLVVDNSTMPPEFAQAVAARLAEAGIAFVDAPVSGGAGGARAGTLAVMAGGDAADVELARPAIMTYAGRLTHVGPVGCGMVAKACNQTIQFLTAAAIAEACNLGQGFGLEVDKLAEAFEGGNADSSVLRQYRAATQEGRNDSITWVINAVRRFLSGDLDPGHRGHYTMLLKDFGVALNSGRATGTAMPALGMVESLFRIMNIRREERPTMGPASQATTRQEPK